ncbi:triadin [Drosophila ficusphila]|uniref:triadin n=1 Tax=Drosophila ficusphila TaxID=30025 RepID=UPI0007E80D46|nr:triadin [Drosophila ficusphila]
MDRLKFNNLVITNKKLIQKARAQTIAKLVQKLRKTKDVLAKNPDSEKEKIRLRKSSECLTQLKSLKCLEIVRQSLLQEGTNPNAVIANERSTPDELGIAMLRLNKLMHGLVDTFAKTLKLSADREAKWREEILETSKRRVKIERTEERKRKRKELKEQKALAKNRLEWLEQNKVAGSAVEEAPTLQFDQEEKVETFQSTIKPEANQALPKEKKEKKVKDKKLKVEKSLSTKDKQSKSDKSVQRSKKESVKKANKEQAIFKENQPQQEVKSKEPKPKPLERKAAKQQKVRPQVEKQLSIDEEEEPKVDNNRPTHVEDPFFITESGQPYLSTAVVLSGDNDSEAEEEERPPTAKKFRNEERRTNTYREKPERQSEFKARKPADDRHPSWLAKQQQTPIIGDFKGKKITFGEDGEASEIKTPIVNPLASSTNTPSSNEGMHPSWVAKQKFKPKIAAFQGTKIKFDED